MTFIEWELFHDKKRNLTAYESLAVDLICRELWWYLLNGSSSTIREGIWLFTKSPRGFYLQAVVMSFIEWELFHDKRMNLTFSANLLVIFICTNRNGIYWIGVLSWNGNEFDHLRIAPDWFYWHEVVIWFIEWVSSEIREGTWPFKKVSLWILLESKRDCIYWRGALPRLMNELDRFWKTPRRFYWHKFVMAFIEWVIFN
jgi:hypothetical protein